MAAHDYPYPSQPNTDRSRVLKTLESSRSKAQHALDIHEDRSPLPKAYRRHPAERLTEDLTRSFFDGLKGSDRRTSASAVSQFLTFAMARLPVPVNARGEQSPRAAAPTKKELALRQKWTLDKLVEHKESDDDLIAKLARKLIDHYLYFQGRIKGEPENLDDVVRFGDECLDLIKSNLALFMQLSAEGRNVASKIDERVVQT